MLRLQRRAWGNLGREAEAGWGVWLLPLDLSVGTRWGVERFQEQIKLLC